MKIRNGFVSNSSSSSFLLTVSKVCECEECGQSNVVMLNFIVNLFAKNGWANNLPEKFTGDTQDYIDSLNFEINELHKDIYWCDKELKKLKEISENDSASKLLDELQNIKQDPSRGYLRNKRGCSKYSTKDRVLGDIRYIELSLERKFANKKALEDKKVLLSKHIGEKLYAFSIDNAETDFRDQINYLIDNGLVNVIEKIQT